MEMLLNEYDMAVGARFENGTIQDYVDDANTYGLLRIEENTVNWFLYNSIESDDDVKDLYEEVQVTQGGEEMTFSSEPYTLYEDGFSGQSFVNIIEQSKVWNESKASNLM